jgi:hypothetical protein
MALAMLPAGGCGHGDPFERTPIEGVVTLDGREVDGGIITFAPVSQGAAATGPIVAGRFRLPQSEGPSPGPYRVEVYCVKPTGRKVPDSDNPKVLIDEQANMIPPRYNVQSELKVEIPPGGRAEPLSLALVTKKSPR